MEITLKQHLKQTNRNLIVQESLDAFYSKNESEFRTNFLPPSPFTAFQINKKL